jgi:hypothetical protein
VGAVSRRAVAALALGIALVVPGCGGGSPASSPQPETQPPLTTTSTTTTSPPTEPMSWDGAGAFVWHETDISPEALGQEMRDNGFRWVAVFLHDGLTVDPVEGDWAARFRRASGLPVGGWGALRTQPVGEAKLASSLVRQYGLDFYIADAEAEYSYSGADGPDKTRFRRSQQFVATFRSRQPSLPAALSSYCRPDQHDIDWSAWSSAGFVFLPQAYVNDFGAAADPTACVRSAKGFFPASDIHPTIGMYSGVSRSLRAAGYARLLAQAGTVGFSVYLAETRMTPDAWSALGAAIRDHGIAHRP